MRLKTVKRSGKRLVRATYQHAPLKRQLVPLLRPLPLPWRVWTRMRFDAGAVTIQIDDEHSFRLNVKGPVEWKLFWRGFGRDWEATSIQLWARLSSSAGTIVDVGSNVGVYSLVARAVNRDARIVAFEPLDRMYQRLTANLTLNDFAITAEQVALSDHEGQALLFDDPRDYNQQASLEASAEARPHQVARNVRLTRLDRYCLEHGIESIDLLKIDIEGHEPQALEGMGSLLTTAKPTMLIEVLTDEAGSRISALLSGLGYETYRIHEGRGLELTGFRSKEQKDRNYLVCQPGVLESHGLTGFVISTLAR